MPTQQLEVPCPVCGGRTFDNRESKKNPKAPDFRCRDKSCEGVIWPPRKGEQGYGHAAPKVQSAPSTAHNYRGGPIKGMDDETDLPPVEAAYEGDTADLAALRMAALFKLHAHCFWQAMELATQAEGHHGVKADLQGISALCAQLFVASNQKGLTI